MSEPEGEKFERISEQELVNVTSDGRGVHFEFEGKTYNIESGVRPNVYNLKITE